MQAVVLNRISLVLAFAGIFIAGVLSIGQYYALSIPCGASHGCSKVALDPSSHALGIPNAYLGFMAYLVLAGLAYWRLVSPGARVAYTLGYALSALGTLGSIILTYYSIAVIHATCIWCLSSTAVMFLLLITHAALMQIDPDPKAESGMLNGVMLAGLSLATIVLLGIQGSQIVNEGSRLGSERIDTKHAVDLYLPPGVHSLGNPDAPVTLIEFGDLVCPACQQEYSKIKTFLGNHQGSARYVYRHFPMINLPEHKFAAPAAIVAEMAAEKGKFWQFLDAMYETSRANMKDVQEVLDVAKNAGLDTTGMVDRMQNQQDPAFQRMMRDMQDGSKVGVEGTPTFFIVAKGVKGVRQSSMNSIWDDLELPEYKKLYKGG